MKTLSSLDLYNGPQLQSSNVVEDDYPTWVQASYSKTNRRIYDARIYESLEDNNTTKPWEGIKTTPATWALVGVPNKWRMFDVVRRSTLQTERADNIRVNVQPYDKVNGLCLFGLDARSVHVQVTDNGVENGFPLLVYDKTFSLLSAGHITNWYLWFTQYPDYDTRLVVLDLPIQYAPILLVTIEKTGGTAKCGKFIAGKQIYLGKTRPNPQTTLIPTSKRQRDYFGELIWVSGSVYREVSYSLLVPTGRLDYIERQLMEIMNRPTVFIGSEKYLSTVVFGAIRGTPKDKLSRKQSVLNFTVEEI